MHALLLYCSTVGVPHVCVSDTAFHVAGWHSAARTCAVLVAVASAVRGVVWLRYSIDTYISSGSHCMIRTWYVRSQFLVGTYQVRIRDHSDGEQDDTPGKYKRYHYVYIQIAHLSHIGNLLFHGRGSFVTISTAGNTGRPPEHPTQVWAPARLRGARSGCSKSWRAGSFRGIAFR